MSKNISIKGTREGLTVALGEGEISELLEELDAHLKVQGAFFKGGTVAVHLGARQVDQYELERLGELLSGYDMALRTVVTSDEVAVNAAQTMGLRTSSPVVQQPQPERTGSVSEDTRVGVPPSGALFVRRTVRSGQVIRHSGPVVVLGDINPSAEVWAGGDVIVWGRALGMVCAGTNGDPEALVCALDLDPLLLRIGDMMARSEDDKKSRGKVIPEVAHVAGGQIVVEPWDAVSLGA